MKWVLIKFQWFDQLTNPLSTLCSSAQFKQHLIQWLICEHHAASIGIVVGADAITPQFDSHPENLRIKLRT